MKNTNVNPVHFVPRSDLEREICARVEAASQERVLYCWSKAEYPYTDINDNQIDIGADYMVQTGRLAKGLYTSGHSYLVWLRPDGPEIEDNGGWRA